MTLVAYLARGAGLCPDDRRPIRCCCKVPRAADPCLRIILCVSVSALLACSKPESASPAATPPQEVMVVKAVARSIPIITEDVGQTRAVQTVEVRSRVDGTLKKIAFEEGRMIARGDLMFVIDRLPFEAALPQQYSSGLISGA
jgi:multidrug efflux pump subunit AcrA (membrane-fusion protein)